MSKKIKLTPPTGNPIEITPEDDSTRIRTRDGLTDTLTLKYSTAKPIEIPIGTTAVWRGDTYTLRRRGDLVMTHSELYRYTLRLTAPADSLPDYIVTNPIDGRIDFPLTATPEEHLQLVIDNLNRRDPGWSIGDHLTDTTPTLITYSRTDCLAALRQIADTFAADLRISGKVISIAPEGEEAKGDALPLRYGQGQGMLSDIRRTAPEEGVIGTLHLVTSDRNIDPAKYGAKTLRLPESDPTGAVTISESRTAITLKGAAKGSPEAVADLSHIYPSREGTVTKAEQPGDGLWDFIDSSIPDSLDYAAATLPGESLLVIFQSGELAGREIEANYKHAERRFQLVPTETDGITLPGGSFVPHAGDRYAVFRCHLPAEYVTAAETRLLEAARRILADRSEEREVITAQIDPIWAKQHWGDVAHRLTPGRYVSFTDPRWHPAPALIRIESITDYLTDPYSPKVELSNHPATTGRITALETELRRGEVRRAEQAQEIRELRERTWRDTETLREQIERLKLDGFTEAVTPETLRTMQAVIGTPALQFDFVRSLTDTAAIPFRWSEGKGGVVTIPAQVIAKLKGGSTLSPEEQQYITTAIPELTHTLKAEERNAYIYAETDPKPRFVVTTDPLEITDTRLLVGLLNGNEGERSFTPLYGFTEITPGQIQTDLIRSKDGKSYWDLLTGEFSSKSGPFIIGDPKGDTALAYIGDTLYVKGATVTLGSGDTTTIEDALLEQERKLKAEEDARAKAEDELERKHAELEEALEGLRQSTGDEQAAMAEILGKVNKTLTSLQDQVNNEVSNWFYPGSPSPDKEPESEWVTDQDKYRHIGDTYTSVDESGEYMGKSWRYTTEYKWQEIHDTLISKALSVAAKAQTTADGKSTTYYTQPAHYSVGDSWVLSADTTVGGKVYKKGTMLFASASSDVFVGAHWGEMLKYIDSAKLDADLRASETKSKEAWEAYAAAQASKAGEETLKAAKEYAEAQDTAYEARTKAYADKILTEKEQALIAAADAKAAAAETRAKAYADGKITATEQLAIDKAQKAYDDAVKRAKEMDGEIQVGGRNLLRGTDYSVIDRLDRRYWSQDLPINHDDTYAYVAYGYAWNYLYKTIHLEPGTYTLSVMAKSHEPGKPGKLRAQIGLWEYGEIFGVTTDEWQRYSLTFDLSEPYDGILRLLESGDRKTLIRFAQIKLERGTVATDWTPAPEDVQAEIDAINANPPRINAKGNWEVYDPAEGKYIDTGRTSKGDNGKAPYIGDNGHWYEWDTGAGAYTNTGVKAIGTDGKDGKDGRGVRPNIFSYKDNPLFAQNDAYGCKIKYLGEGRYKVWKEVNGSSKGWGGASYYVPRVDNSLKTEDQVTSFRIVECSTEILSHNNNGAPYGYPREKKYGAGDTFVFFPREKGRVAGFAFEWDGSGALGGSKGDYVIFDQYKAEIVTGEADKRPTAYIPHPHDAKGDKGDGLDIIDTRKDNRPPSWYRENYKQTTVREFKTQSAIEIPSRWIYGIYCTLETVVRWINPSGGRVEQSTTLDNGVQLRRVGTEDDTAWEPWINVSAEVAAIKTGLASADTAIDALKAADKAIKAGMLTTSDLPDIGWLLDAFNNGKTVTSGGLLLTKVIALSNQSNKITSYISGYDGAGKAMLAAGISDLTADPDTATSYIGYDGKAKFGSLHIEKGSLSISEMPEPTIGKVKYGRLYITPTSINTWISAAERMTLSYNSGVKTKRLDIGDSSDSKIETITLRITPVSGIGGGNVDITGDLTVHGQIKGGEGKVRYIWDAATSVWIEPEDAHIFLWSPYKNSIYLPKADEVEEGWTVTIDWSKARGVPLTIRTQGKSAIVKSDNISTILSPEANPDRFVITRINPARALDGNSVDWWATEFKVW